VWCAAPPPEQGCTYEHTTTERDPWDGETTARTTRGQGRWTYDAGTDTLHVQGEYLPSQYTDLKHCADEDVYTTSGQGGAPLVMALSPWGAHWQKESLGQS